MDFRAQAKHYLTLFRTGIAFFAACSAAMGFFLSPHRHAPGVLIPAAAVFFLACGASALNQYQDRNRDAKMDRTRARPLPSGALAPALALAAATASILAGLLILFFAGSGAFALGLFALLWYNGVYTSLKRVTAFAAIPGAAVGMVPPAVGFVAGGGSPFDAKIVVICLIFFLWQVPHFWLLVLKYGEDYERAGLPSLTQSMDKAQISRVTFAWLTAAATASLALPLYGPMRTPPFYFSLLALVLWLIGSGASLRKRGPLPSLSAPLFKKINIYLFVMMTLLALEGLLF